MMSDFCLFVLFIVDERTGRQSNYLPIPKCYWRKNSNVRKKNEKKKPLKHLSTLNEFDHRILVPLKTRWSNSFIPILILNKWKIIELPSSISTSTGL